MSITDAVLDQQQLFGVPQISTPTIKKGPTARQHTSLGQCPRCTKSRVDQGPTARSIALRALAASALRLIPILGQAQEPPRRPFGAEDTTTIHIRLLNGKTGQPIADKEIFLERNKTRLLSHAEEHDIRTDPSGLAEATVAKTGDILNPIVVDYKSCTPRTKHNDETGKSERFPIAQILTNGVVAHNACSKTAQSPTPGELTLYFRPMNVFERLTD